MEMKASVNKVTEKESILKLFKIPKIKDLKIIIKESNKDMNINSKHLLQRNYYTIPFYKLRRIY